MTSGTAVWIRRSALSMAPAASGPSAMARAVIAEAVWFALNAAAMTEVAQCQGGKQTRIQVQGVVRRCRGFWVLDGGI